MRAQLLIMALVGCAGEKSSRVGEANTAPSITVISPESGTNVVLGTPINFLAYVSDDESPADDLLVSWASERDGDLFADYADEDGNSSFEFSELREGAHTIRVTAVDPSGAESSTTVLASVYVQGERPEVTGLYSEDTTIQGDALQVSAEVIDSDNSPGDLTVEFQVWPDSDNASEPCDDDLDESLEDDGDPITACELSATAIGEDIDNKPGSARCDIRIDTAGWYRLDVTVTDLQGNTGAARKPCILVIATDDEDRDDDGFSESEGDCDDDDSSVYPGAIEQCDGIDNDCDALVDENDPDTDGDGDGFSACDSHDCDDADDSVHPDATERCNDKDDNCDGVVDEDSAIDALEWFLDADSDTYGSDTSTMACEAPPGHVSDSSDCNDTDASVNPGATEVCDDEDTDEDCSGTADGSDASGRVYWYLDLDDDGYPTPDIYELNCDAFGSYIASEGLWDCDDSRADINPGMEERCDYFGLDENCNGEVNEPGAVDGVLFYRDNDGDGYGDPYYSQRLCAAGDVTDYDVTNNEDCCDFDNQANPSATAYRTIYNACFSYDWNCDGTNELETDYTGECSGVTFSGCNADPEGWVDEIPSCGDSAEWVFDCSYDPPFSCDPDTGYQTQACR